MPPVTRKICSSPHSKPHLQPRAQLSMVSTAHLNSSIRESIEFSRTTTSLGRAKPPSRGRPRSPVNKINLVSAKTQEVIDSVSIKRSRSPLDEVSLRKIDPLPIDGPHGPVSKANLSSVEMPEEIDSTSIKRSRSPVDKVNPPFAKRSRFNKSAKIPQFLESGKPPKTIPRQPTPTQLTGSATSSSDASDCSVFSQAASQASSISTGFPPKRPSSLSARVDERDLNSDTDSIYSSIDSEDDIQSDSSFDDMSDSLTVKKAASRQRYTRLAAEEDFRTNRLEGNNIHFVDKRLGIDTEKAPDVVLTTVNLIKKQVNYPSPDKQELARVRATRFGDTKDTYYQALPPEHLKFVDEMGFRDGTELLNLEGDEMTGLQGDNGEELEDVHNEEVDNEEIGEFPTYDDMELESYKDEGVGMGEAVQESSVKFAFERGIFQLATGYALGTIMELSDTPISGNAVPGSALSGQSKTKKIPIPVPDTLHGIPRGMFSDAIDREEREEGKANSQVMYPVMASEYKSGGNKPAYPLWVAENQLIISLVMCSNLVGKLNDRFDALTGSEVKLNTTAFGLVTNGADARLFVSWREKNNGIPSFHIRYVEVFHLVDPEQYLKLRMYILNIFQWARERKITLEKAALTITELRNMTPSPAPPGGSASPSRTPNRRITTRGSSRKAQVSNAAGSPLRNQVPRGKGSNAAVVPASQSPRPDTQPGSSSRKISKSMSRVSNPIRAFMNSVSRSSTPSVARGGPSHQSSPQQLPLPSTSESSASQTRGKHGVPKRTKAPIEPKVHNTRASSKE